jgi:hypothetical protein
VHQKGANFRRVAQPEAAAPLEDQTRLSSKGSEDGGLAAPFKGAYPRRDVYALGCVSICGQDRTRELTLSGRRVHASSRAATLEGWCMTEAATPLFGKPQEARS